MSLYPRVVRLFYIPNTYLSYTWHNRTSRRLGLVALLCCLLLVLAACGPQRKAGEAGLTADAIRIAQEYEQSGDLNHARAQLQGLDAANPTQWLIYLAESRIDEQPGAAETDALVWLAMALGLQSRTLLDYATQNNLLVNVPPTVESVVDTVAAPVVVAAVTKPPEAVAPTPAPAVAPAAVITATGAVTSAATSVVTVTESAPLSVTATAVATPAVATLSKPMAQASTSINVRSGPGVDYVIVGAIAAGEQVEIVAKNPQSDWWQVILTNGQPGWVYGSLVQTTGDTAALAVAANIPAPPPTATPAPVAAAPTAEPAPAEQPPAEAPPASDKPHFSLVDRRMWSKAENGDCRGQHLLRIHVLDANGNRLNGVALQGIYTGEIIVTGSQGKGDGIIEYDLYGPGEGFRVIRDMDGREASSDSAEGFTTRSLDIPMDLLIPAGYCSDEASCKIFYSSYGCQGHHSWEATFKRNY